MEALPSFIGGQLENAIVRAENHENMILNEMVIWAP